MGELSIQVLKGFGVHAAKVRREKAYYICETADGLRMIRQTPDTGEHLIFQHEIKEHMARKGYPWTDRFYTSVSGAPYVTANGERYIMTDYWDGSKTDFGAPGVLARLTEAVARWHHCARDIDFSGETRLGAVTTGADFFRKQSSALNVIRKRVSRQARLSDFDVLFIKNAGAFTQHIEDAATLLDTTRYAELSRYALSHHHICHNALKEESIFVGDQTVYITQYTDAAPGCQLNDLCGLIRRFESAAPAWQTVEAYSRVAPLAKDDIKILYALLLYPHGFVKTVTQYYSKKRTWTPSAVLNRMQAVVARQAAFIQYINDLSGH